MLIGGIVFLNQQFIKGNGIMEIRDIMGGSMATLPEYADTRFYVWQDTDAESPTEWDSASSVLVFNTARNYRTDSPVCAVSEAFYRVYDETGDDDLALKVARRYSVLRGVYRDIEHASAHIVTSSVTGYSPSEWWDILVITEHGYGDAESLADVWAQWARGDVYSVTADRFTPCEHSTCRAEHYGDESHWDSVESCGGFYADSVEEVLNEFIPAFM